MRSVTPHPRIIEYADDSLEVVADICIATDLLQELFSGLRSVASTNPDLAAEMSSRESTMLDRLRTLNQTADQLLSLNDFSTAAALMGRAKLLISSLSADIDEVAMWATDDEWQSHSYGQPLH